MTGDVILRAPRPGWIDADDRAGRQAEILVELDPADDKLERLLYVGASRARQHLILIGSPAG